MRDDFLGAEWTAAHHHLTRRLTTWFHKLSHGFMASMEQLRRHQFDAPWQRPARRSR